MVEKVNSADFSNERDMKASDRERQARKSGKVPIWNGSSEGRRGGDVSAKAACAAPQSAERAQEHSAPVPTKTTESMCNQLHTELDKAKHAIKNCMTPEQIANLFGIEVTRKEDKTIKLCTMLIFIVIAFTLGMLFGSKKSVYKVK